MSQRSFAALEFIPKTTHIDNASEAPKDASQDMPDRYKPVHQPAHAILRMQQTHGNAYVCRYLNSLKTIPSASVVQRDDEDYGGGEDSGFYGNSGGGGEYGGGEDPGFYGNGGGSEYSGEVDPGFYGNGGGDEYGREIDPGFYANGGDAEYGSNVDPGFYGNDGGGDYGSDLDPGFYANGGDENTRTEAGSGSDNPIGEAIGNILGSLFGDGNTQAGNGDNQRGEASDSSSRSDNSGWEQGPSSDHQQSIDQKNEAMDEYDDANKAFDHAAQNARIGDEELNKTTEMVKNGEMSFTDPRHHAAMQNNTTTNNYLSEATSRLTEASKQRSENIARSDKTEAQEKSGWQRDPSSGRGNGR